MKNKGLESVFSVIGFEKMKTIKGSPESTFGIYFGIFKKQEVILKVARNSYKLKIEQLEKEIFIDNKIIKNIKKDKQINAVEVIEHGYNQDFSWVIRSFASGQSLAKYNPKFPLLGYDLIEKKFLKSEKIIISQIKNIIESIETVDISNYHSPMLKSRYQSDIKNYDIIAVEKYYDINLKNHLAFYEANFENYSKKSNIRLSIGDLTPANLIVDSTGVVALSDYELFSLESNLMDLTYLWLFLWRYPNWQKLLIEDKILSEQDKIFFRLNIIKILLFLYSWPWGCVSEITNEKKKEQNRLHIWKRYLIAAGESYEAILKVK